MINVLEYIPYSRQRDSLLEKIKTRLQDILSKTKNTSHEYTTALAMLSSEDKPLLIQAMLTQPHMHIETIRSLDLLSKYLDNCQYSRLLSHVAEKIPGAVSKYFNLKGQTKILSLIFC